MSDLDERLAGIVKDSAVILEANRDVGPRKYEIALDIFVADLLPQIKQAFADAGYVHIPQVEVVTRYERNQKPEVFMVNGKELMTGQEWYDRFSDELKSLTSRGDGETWMGWGCDEVIASAKKATGLPNA